MDGWMDLHIGPDSIKTFSEALDTTKTIIWNGPMGVFEFDKFAVGTEAIAKKLVELSGKGVTTIIGGGDSVEKMGFGRQDEPYLNWKRSQPGGEATPCCACA